MGFSALDFDKIYENGGKEFLETEYKEYTCTQNFVWGDSKFDIGIKVDLEKFKKAYDKKPKKLSEEESEKFDEERKQIRADLDEFAKKTAEKLYKKGIISDVKGNLPSQISIKESIIGYNIIDEKNIREIDEEFEECRRFVEDINFYEMHVFKYSPRKGTVAAGMKEQFRLLFIFGFYIFQNL